MEFSAMSRALTCERCFIGIAAFIAFTMGCRAEPRGDNPVMKSDAFSRDHGGIIRGDKSKKHIAMIFTGGDFGEGTPHILDILKKLNIQAGLFVTGDFLRKEEYNAYIRRAVAEGHYVGPHSDKHLLYCPWEDREKTLVSDEQFKADLQKNIDDLKKLGALKGKVYFIPPYEWFNEDQVRWAKEMGVTIFNLSPGSGSSRDYQPESDKRFTSSQQIMQGILDHEKKDPAGLNGFILLLHLGADRKDKMFLLLEPLMKELMARGYGFVRIDAMLAEDGKVTS
jgi:peptidoglycan/xylan/chitin deacetylase (PgdA/CDA1 family)